MFSDPDFCILETVEELNFGIGKRLLAGILFGEKSTQIQRLKLYKNRKFGAMDLHQKEEILDMIESLVFRGYLEIKRRSENRFLPVLYLTKKGKEFISKGKKRIKGEVAEKKKIQEEMTHADSFGDGSYAEFLGGYNDEQRSAIVSNASRILCIAGAGSGKTTVLTRRIEFLSNFKGVSQNRILAITFTRKARQEMLERLEISMPGHNIPVETFNSFSERQLRIHSGKHYKKSSSVLDFNTKIDLAVRALNELGYGKEKALQEYYSPKKLLNGESKDLFFMMLNDFYSLMDYLRNNNEDVGSLEDSLKYIYDQKSKRVLRFSIAVIRKIMHYKSLDGLRDYTDQMTHCVNLFVQFPELIPRYEHILVDEYQDVNHIQVQLLDILRPKNLFCVGDPRQSIFGWRGSKINYILKFREKFKKSSIIHLSKNYRSTPEIVEIANRAISPMNLQPLEAMLPPGEEVRVIKHGSEEDEALFISQVILSSDTPRNEIFVLCRTNRQLDIISKVLDKFKIPYLKRTDEAPLESNPDSDQITLSTIHAIKGLEAETVILAGANTKNYPCLVQEHPALEIIKRDDYDKYSEEMRVFYVGLTRAKKKLIVSYSGNLTYFLRKRKKSRNLSQRLIYWRSSVARDLNIPPNLIFDDHTLLLLIKEKPSTLEDLSETCGFNKFKLKNFGKDILGIINRES